MALSSAAQALDLYQQGTAQVAEARTKHVLDDIAAEKRAQLNAPAERIDRL